MRSFGDKRFPAFARLCPDEADGAAANPIVRRVLVLGLATVSARGTIGRRLGAVGAHLAQSAPAHHRVLIRSVNTPELPSST